MANDMQMYSGYSEPELAILAQFQNAEARPERGFVVDFLGVRHRLSALWPAARRLDGQVLGQPVPGDFHAETVEWVGTLKSVAAAKDRFVAMELGAGYGTWVVGSGVAARQRGITSIKLYGVEADPQHFASMEQHFRDNGFEPAEHRIIQAAVGVEAGVARWPKLPDSSEPVGWGVRPVHGNEQEYMGRAFEEMIEVKVVAMRELIALEPEWHLVHIDVQGHEFNIIRSSIDLLNERVRWMVVGTHSRKIDGDILEIMCRAGWALENEKPTKFQFWENPVTLEAMTTHDGTQVWRNPRFA
jgi:FkbM family methyltransferase